MNKITRRKLISGGVVAAAGVAGLGAADRIAKRYGLIPPDGGGVYGPGETLTYACQRLLTVNRPAREFPRSMISRNPFANEIAPPTDSFKRLQAGGFRDWRLVVDGTVAHPLALSLGDL
jgi:DMSO/TMAO reductase YedYZ molybdopterin-dependent catalytic subunit